MPSIVDPFQLIMHFLIMTIIMDMMLMYEHTVEEGTSIKGFKTGVEVTNNKNSRLLRLNP